MLKGLDSHDRRALDEHASRISKGAVSDLAGLLSRWERLVTEVEAGYEFTIYDYVNDLVVRDWLARVVEDSRAGHRDVVASLLAPIDGRFVAATRPVGRPLRPGSPAAWWRRVPRSPGEALADDLEAFGETESS